MGIYYTCGNSGNVRGNCGHRHYKMSAAVKCLRRDESACFKAGGFSDRTIEAVEDGTRRKLTWAEMEQEDYHYCHGGK